MTNSIYSKLQLVDPTNVGVSAVTFTQRTFVCVPVVCISSALVGSVGVHEAFHRTNSDQEDIRTLPVRMFLHPLKYVSAAFLFCRHPEDTLRHV